MPEFTMQALSSETGVPGHTVRSWQRRYGFPESSRNESNYRLFSRRDIEAVLWVREQTERGQGTREAIAMLRRMLDEDSAPPSPAPSTPPLLVPVRSLANALVDGDMDAAQRAWDRLSLSLSPDALCSEVILPALGRVWETGVGLATRVRADAFLRRKVTGLLDQSAPERGLDDIVILTQGDARSQVPALALATVLSRAGYRLPLPVLDAGLAETIVVLQQVANRSLVVLVTEQARPALMDALGERTIYTWWDSDGEKVDANPLPHSILDVAKALKAGG